MKKLFVNSKTNEKIKKRPFFPYQDKVRSAYFIYFGLFCFFTILVYVFSLFIIINLVINNKFEISSDIKDINLFCTPIFNIVLITLGWILLLFAPRKIYQSPKHSVVMFYFSFWFLVISVVLNSQLQLTYADTYADASFYNWINFSVLKVLVVVMVFALFFIQVFFWVMRHKFAFMPTDYEIYQQRSMDKKVMKKEKKAKKLLRKQAKKSKKNKT